MEEEITNLKLQLSEREETINSLQMERDHLQNERNQYYNWWSSAEDQVKHLKTIVKELLPMAKI